MNEEDSVLGLLYKQLEDEKAALSAAIIQGNVGDFAAYKMLTGKVHGLAMAQGLINEMADRLRRQLE
jgi:hypothetical protein